MDAEQVTSNERMRRAAKRRSVRMDVKIRRPGEGWVRSRIADVSISGFRLDSFMKLSIGSELWVMLPGFEGRRAHVLWTHGYQSGCAFEQPLHPAILDHIILNHHDQAR